MIQNINPFHDLYLTEAIGADKFVKLFSPIFVQYGLSLYQPGNVVLKGLQGSGKTMLLNLLKPDVRIAYINAGIEFPVPKEFRKYIGAGINLRKSGVSSFSQVLEKDDNQKKVKEVALFFGDFINYWVIYDLLQNIELYWNRNDKKLLKEIGIYPKDSNIDDFAQQCAADDCWEGYMNGVQNYDDFKERVRQRISTYRRYINTNIDELPKSYHSSKSVIGAPILRAAMLLRDHGIIEDDVQVFIRIDQYEELPTLDFSGKNLGVLCQELIHKALSSRDPRVSFRVGVRQYAWPELPIIFNTTGALENKRDYSVINIDETLKRRENRKTWIFPDFAEDIFRRRVELTNYLTSSTKGSLLEKVFGKGLSPEEKSKRYVKNADARIRILKINEEWPGNWVEFLKKLAADDPFSAKLAEGWVRQVRGNNKQQVMHDIPTDKPYPWEEKIYWKKERTEQALVQIASRNSQQLIWAGTDDVLGISGGNILIFLFICQQIWDVWLRENNTIDNNSSLPCIDESSQTIGFINASEEWLKKPKEGENSSVRIQLLTTLGHHFYNELTNDLAMSYPGKNGFSLKTDDLKKDGYIKNLLCVSVDYGDLHEATHTSKSKGEKRVKYYLAPIFCPAFKIPYKHTKEPEYINIKQLYNWISQNDNKATPHTQGSLFGEE